MGLIGAAVGAAGSIFGGISASEAMKRRKRMIERQMRENQDWYDRRYNEDATQRADAQRVLSMTEESIRNRNRAAAGAQAVTGGTDESTAAAKAANSKALADAAGDISAAGERQKSAVESRYLGTKADLEGRLQDMEAQRANAISQAIRGVAGAAGSVGDGLSPGKKKKPGNDIEGDESDTIMN